MTLFQHCVCHKENNQWIESLPIICIVCMVAFGLVGVLCLIFSESHPRHGNEGDNSMQVKFENIDLKSNDGQVILKLDGIVLDHVRVKIDANKASVTLSQENEEQLSDSAEKPLAEYSPGDVISIAGYDFIVLDHDGDGMFVILKDILLSQAFDSVSNTWWNSELRKWLGGSEFWQAIVNELDGELLYFQRDLTSVDGLRDYGKVFDQISLLTLEEYRKYHTILGLKSGYKNDWWLATPWSTPSNGLHRAVCSVLEVGSCDGFACDAIKGVRPVLCIRSSCCVKQGIKTNKEE